MFDVSAYPLWVQFSLIILATYRVSSLISQEEGPYIPWIFPQSKEFQIGVFESIRKSLGVYDEQRTSLSRGIACPLCVGMYVSLLMLLVWQLPNLSLVIVWLGVAGGQQFLYQLQGGNS